MCLYTGSIRRFSELYCNNTNIAVCNNDYRFSPARTPADILAQFPPTVVVLAKYDALLDEGQEFAEKLNANGVHVFVHYYNNTIHYFYVKHIFKYGYAALKQVMDQFVKISAAILWTNKLRKCVRFWNDVDVVT